MPMSYTISMTKYNILDALVEMTMKQALAEFMQEQEMAELQRDTDQYIAFKEMQNSEMKRLNAKQINKDDADKENENANRNDDDENINAAKLLHNYVSTRLPDVLSAVDADINNIHLLEVDANFQPWLAQEIATEVGQMIDSPEELSKLVKTIVEQRAEHYLNQEIK